MISLTLTNVKKFMSQLLMTETFDRFSFIEGEIVTFNTFKLDGYLQKDFFDAPDGYESESSPTPLEEYSRWGDIPGILLFPHQRKADTFEFPLDPESVTG